MSETQELDDDEAASTCRCGMPEYDRCVECGGCDCPENPGTCEGPGCYSIDAYEQDAEEYGWEGDSYGVLGSY